MSTVRPIVCVGALHVDAKARVSGAVVPRTSNPAVVTRTPGGVACNVARTLAKLEVPVSLVSVVGDDALGRGLVARVAGEGVGVDGVVMVAGAATAEYTAVLDGSGALAVGVADMAIYEHLDAAVIRPAVDQLGWSALWCADANVTPSGLATLVPVAPDLYLDPVSVAKAPKLLPLLPGVAGVFPDVAEATALTRAKRPERAVRSLIAAGVGRVVVTLGPAGVLDSAGMERRRAFAAGPVVDVTGAGDAFLAGFLAALAHAEPDPVAWGLAAASLAVETLESVPDDLSLSKLQARLG